MVVVGAATIGVRLFVTAREVIAAHQFGVGNAMDAFFIAYMVPIFVVGVIAGSFSAAVIPIYLDVLEKKGAAAAQRLYSSVTVWTTALLAVVTVVMAAVVPLILPLLTPSFSSEKRSLAVDLFLVMLPLVMISGIATIWAAVLNAHHRFAFAALIPIVTPMLTIALLLVAASQWGVYTMAAGATLGALCEASLLSVALKRQGLPVLPRTAALDADVRSVFRQYVPMSVGALLMGSTLLIDQALAATLRSGSVATLNYGQRIVAFVIGISAIAIGTAVMPYFSRLVAQEEWATLRKTYSFYLRVIVIGGIGCAVALWLVSTPLVHTLFQHGAFTAADTKRVVEVQRLAALQIPFYLGGILVVRLISSVRANHLLMWGAAINAVLNLALDIVLMRWLGVAGIALSTAGVYAGSFVFVWLALRRRFAKMNIGME